MKNEPQRAVLLSDARAVNVSTGALIDDKSSPRIRR